jgi:hypothetical protein
VDADGDADRRAGRHAAGGVDNTALLGLEQLRQGDRRPLPPEAMQRLLASVPSNLGRYVALPPRYRDPDGSGLSVVVRPGSQQLDFNLQ